VTGLRIGGAVGERVRFRFDGREVEGLTGESLAAALIAAGIHRLGSGPQGGSRSAFCMMGVCQECVVLVDGRRVEACRVAVREGLDARSRG
jgi:predicted molibdopterin-dependent oxidoreductase YjgC